MERKKIDTAPKKSIKTFEGAKKKADDLKAMEENRNPKNAGAPIKGQSKATNQVRFTVDDETYTWLLKQTVKADGMPAKERTAHAVAKKILMAHYELGNQ